MMNLSQLFRRTLLVLIYALPLLLIVYAVVMGSAALLGSLGDDAGSLALRWVGTLLAALFVSGLIALVLLLAWDRVRSEEIDQEL